jgi:hypothetical protein
MVGSTLPENKRMQGLAKSLGFDIETDPEDPRQVRVTLSL